MTVSEHPDVVLPAAMVEAAAQVLFVKHCNDDGCDEIQMDEARLRAHAGLAAALGVCQVREECRASTDSPASGPPYSSTWADPPGPLWARAPGRVVTWQRRLSIRTPAEPVDTEGAAT